MVAHDEDLVSMEFLEDVDEHELGRVAEITVDDDSVVNTNLGVPPPDEFTVHLDRVDERSVAFGDDAEVAEVGICCVVIVHISSFLFGQVVNEVVAIQFVFNCLSSS